MPDAPPSLLSLRSELSAWLNLFPLATRTKGRRFYAEGRVQNLDLHEDPPSTSATAEVEGDTDRYSCTLSHASGEGWDGECSCPVSCQCKHLFAFGSTLLDHFTQRTLDAQFSAPAARRATSRQPAPPVAASAKFASPAAPAPAAPIKFTSPAEEAVARKFAAATGALPDRRQLAFLRNLMSLHLSVQHGHYTNIQALQNLVPQSHREGSFGYYDHPFADRWERAPATPLDLWSHVALLFTERALPLPDFMAPLTDIEGARRAVESYRLERTLATWRAHFSQLEQALRPVKSAADAAPRPLRTLRLRLGRKKTLWEISDDPADSPTASPPAAPPFLPLSATALRDFLSQEDEAALTLEPASATLAMILRSRLAHHSRIIPKLEDYDDRQFLHRLLLHPIAQACIVADDGRPLRRESRHLIWQFRDHPENPGTTVAHLVFADGAPAPAPLRHFPGRPDFYLHEDTLYPGLPPLEPYAADPTAPVAVPRAALALPEAGRFAARAGIALPGDISGRFRSERLRPCLRARLESRSARFDTTPREVVVVELFALAPDGAPRARHDQGAWQRSGPGLPPPPPDSAFLLLDFEPTRAAADHLRKFPFYLDDSTGAGRQLCADLTASAVESFAAWLLGFPADTLIELAPELAALTQAPTRASFALDLQPDDESGIDWFDVRVTLRAEDTTLTPEELTLLAGARGRFVRLAGKGWRRLAVDESPAAREKLARLGLDLPAAIGATTEPHRFHALQLADEALQDAIPEKIWAQVRERSAALRALPAPPVPPGLVADIRPYQHEGFHFLAWISENNFGGILADDMGLGKTLQTLAWLLHLARQKTTRSDEHQRVDPTLKPVPVAASASESLPSPSPSTPRLNSREMREPRGAAFRALVICPKSVVFNWQLETARFAPALATTAFTPALVTPASADSSSRLSTLSSALLIANYTQLRLHAEAFASESWDAVILDEGQNIKNPSSATAQAARALRTRHRLVLTGTPVENRLLDLWSLFAFAQPGLLGHQTAFKRLYNDKTDPEARHRLAQRVKHFLLRRTKSQVARELPPRIEEDLHVELEGPQRKLYDAELKRARQLLLGIKSNRDFDSQRFNILQSLLRLRQICCDPRLVQSTPSAPAKPKKVAAKSTRRPASLSAPDPKPQTQDPSPPSTAAPSSAKLEALFDTLEPLLAGGHKVLIFSQFVTMLELIRDELAARSIAHLLLTGQTDNRQELVERFQSDPAIPVFLLSLKAAGSGLNLTAASYVVLFDPWWNPAVEAQAIDRTHRIGQKNQVIAYRLLARNTIEEKIRALQKEKATLAAAVVQEESLTTVLDLDSLRRILA